MVYAINLFSHLPVCQSQRTLTLIVSLRSTECSKRQLVSIVQTLRDIHEISIACEIQALSISVTPALRTQQSECPSALRHTCRNAEHHLVHIVVTKSVRYHTAFLRIGRTSNNVDSTTYRRSRYLRSTKTTLVLDITSYIAKTSPVRPVNVSVFHIVHRNAVYHYRYVGVIETTHIDFRVTVTTTFFVGMHTRS